MRKFITFVVFCLLIFHESTGQTFFNNKYNRRFIVSGGSGISSYYGDLNSSKDKLDYGINLFGGLQYMINPQIGVRVESGYFRLSGDDAEKKHPVHLQRNLSFRSNNFELNTNIVYNIMPGGSRFYQRQVVNPFVFAGFGFLKYNPRAKYQGKTYGLRRLQTEGKKYSQFTGVVPLGGGARIMINPYFNAVIEIGYRKTFSDYLDDVSTRHIDKSTLLDPIAVALTDRAAEAGYSPREAGAVRGNPKKKDAYLLINAKVEYYLPANTFKKPGGQSIFKNLFGGKKRGPARRRR